LNADALAGVHDLARIAPEERHLHFSVPSGPALGPPTGSRCIWPFHSQITPDRPAETKNVMAEGDSME
jgi:hypothetical protein